MAKFQQWIDPQGLMMLEGWARDGLTDEQIAHNCGISRTTLHQWKKQFPELSEALKRGKEVVDYEVENALLKRALGYEYTEVMTEESDVGAKRRETTKQAVPDIKAQIFWLKNRKPGKWRVKPSQTEDATEDSGVVLLAPVPEEEQPT